MKKLLILKLALLASLFVFAFSVNAQVELPILSNSSTCADLKCTITNYNGDAMYSYTYTVNGGVEIPVTYSTFVIPAAQATLPCEVQVKMSDGMVEETASISLTYATQPVPPAPTVVETVLCDEVRFRISNYNAQYQYQVEENGVWTRMYQNKTVNTGNNGDEISFQFKTVDGHCESAPVQASATFAATPQKPVIVASDVCSDGLRFTLTNPQPGMNYTWLVNGYNVTNRVVNNVYEETNPIDGQSYVVQVTASNALNETCTAQQSINHTYVALPPAPQVSNYEACQVVGSKAWTDLLLNYDATTYSLVWYDQNGLVLTAHQDVFDTYTIGEIKGYVAYKNKRTHCVGAKTPILVNIGEIPTANAGLDQTTCVAAAVTVGTPEQNGMRYRWSCVPNTGLFDNATKAQPQVTFNRAGTYTVMVEAYNPNMPACKATSSAQVEVLETPTLALEQTLRNGKDLWVCEGEAALLSVANPDNVNLTYTWSDPYALLLGNVTMGSSVSTRVLTPADNGHALEVTASYNNQQVSCSATKQINLVVQNKPVADASGMGVSQYNVCKDESVVLGLPNVPNYRYQWTPADALRNGNTTIAQPNTMPLGNNASVQYTLQVTDVLTGCVNTSDVTLNAVQSPSMYNVTVTNNGLYCQGSDPTNVDIKIGASDLGTEYALVRMGDTGQPAWIPGTGAALQWQNITSGSYTIKARVSKGNVGQQTYCEVDLNATPILVQEKNMAQVSLQRANMSERLCPNTPVTMQLLFTQGVSPYEVVLGYYDAQDVLKHTEVIPNIVQSPYTFTYTPQGYTKIAVMQVSDSQGCVRNYQSDAAPQVEIDIPNAEDFVIEPSTRLAVCPGETVVLSTNYDPATYPNVEVKWSMGSDYDNMGTVSIQANETATYTMTVRMPEMGCEFENTYTVEVKERLNPDILDLEDKYCANPNVDEPLITLSSGTITGGEWTCPELPALLQGGNLDLNAVTQTGTYTIRYKVGNGGCEEVVEKSTYIYAMQEVVFDIAPVILPINSADISDKLQYCVPAGNNKNVTLQGYPLTEDGKWELISYVGQGATAATLVPIGDPGQSMAQLKNLASQGNYKVRYTVKDNAGCDSYAEKDVVIVGQHNVTPTADGYNLLNEAGRLAPTLANGPTICYNDAEATIYANVPQNIKSAQFSTPAINPLSNVNDQPGAANGRWTIYPNNAASAQARGAQSVIFTYETSQGCPFKERFDFYINEGVTIHPFELEDSYCTGDPDVPLHVQSQGATQGYVTIDRIDEAGNVLENVVNSQVASTPAVFSPGGFAPGKYCITYKYSDDNNVCEDEHKQYTYLHAPADIVFDFPKDHCWGAEVKLNTIPQTAAIELISSTPADALVNQTFYADRAGLGKHTIRCTVIDDNVCTAVEEMDIMVHGANTEDMTINGVAAQYCAPQGLVDVEAFPNVPGFGTFEGCEHLSPFIYPVLDAAGNPVSGKATIDLSKGNYNQEYTIYYKYKTDYVTDQATGTSLTCETTISKDFEILSEFVEFTGFSDGAVLCGNKESILLESNKKGSSQASNVTFTFSNPSIANAFVDHGDGTATLYPANLPEGGYHVEAVYNYMVDVNGIPTSVCTSSVLKHFRISKVEQVNDIYFSCLAPDELNVCLQSTEDHVRYELFINGYSVQQKVGTGAPMCFDVPVGNADYIEAMVTGTDVDNNYCVVEMTKTIQTNQLKLQVEETPITCFGKEDGTITAQITGGKPSYVIQNLTNQQTGMVSTGVYFDHLAAGTYTYQVQDQYGCQRTAQVEIEEPTELVVNFSHKSALCSREATGQARADVVVGTGTAPYTYKWYHVADPTVTLGSDMSIGGLGGANNNYSYKGEVTDARGCTKEYAFTINAPSDLTLQEDVTKHIDVEIVGESTGQVAVVANGGKSPYTYTWTGGNMSPAVTTTDAIISTLTADTYYITVTDDNGCSTAPLVVEVTQPTAFTVTDNVSHVSCHGGSDGKIDLDIAGGTQPYVKTEWTKEGVVISNSIDLIGVTAGDYKFTLEDSNGNTLSKTYRINQADPFAIEVSLTSNTALTCYGDADANIDIALLGGMAPYQVTWEGLLDEAQQLSADRLHASGLAKGQYRVWVKDNNGCEAKLPNPITVSQPNAPITLAVDIQHNICHNDLTGSIKVQPNGGTGAYTYQWTGSGIEASKQDAQNQENIEAGNYQVTVTDATGICTATQSFVLENPNPLAVNVEATQIDCYGGKGEAKAVVTQAGRGNLTFQWTDATGTEVGTADVITRLDEGKYTLTVTDNNGNGCAIQQTVDIVQNDPIVLQVESGDVDCYDNKNGWAKVQVTGGSGQFNYSWELIGGGVISTSAQVSNLDAGNYRVTVSEKNNPNCKVVSDVIRISQPQAPLSITYHVQDVKIHGEATGGIALTPQGGTPSVMGEYNYQWLDGPGGFTAAETSSAIISNRLAGTYWVRVSDTHGCEQDAVIEIKQPQTIQVEATVKNVTCNSQSDGAVIIDANGITGGNGTYTCLWTWTDQNGTPQSYVSTDPLTYSLNNVGAGNYELLVTDTDNNTFNSTFQITQADALSITTVLDRSKLNLNCYGDADGAIYVAIQGGATPYQSVVWSTATQPTESNFIENLTVGNYNVTVTDANGCSLTHPVEITQPQSPLALTYSVTQNKCFGDTQGVIEVAVTGGNGTQPSDYTYHWSGGVGLKPGTDVYTQDQLPNNETYVVRVVDSKGCEISQVFDKLLVEPTPLSIAVETGNVDCNGNQTGWAEATILSPGSGNYNYYKWESEDGTYLVTNLKAEHLKAGKYTFSIEDTNGCMLTQQVEITQPDPLTVTLDAPDVLCNGINEADIYAQVQGGVQNYAYQWELDNVPMLSETGKSFLHQQGKGNYRVTITDANGCVATDEHLVRWSDKMSFSKIEVTHVEIHGAATGAIEVEVQGGTTPPDLSYDWTTIGGAFHDPTDSQDQNNLIAGTYSLLVTDALGCELTTTQEVKQPEYMRVDYQLQDIVCPGDKGAISITAEGGYQPYQVTITGPNGYTQQGENLFEVSNLEPGNYTIVVRDAKLNQAERLVSISPVLDLKRQFHQSFTQTQLKCYGDATGRAMVEVTGGTSPYHVIWSGQGIEGLDSKQVENLQAGIYTATITDSRGCEAEGIELEITQPQAPLSIAANVTDNTCQGAAQAAIDITVTGGTPHATDPNYSYRWTGISAVLQAEDQVDLYAGDYQVEVTDANGCSVKESFVVGDPMSLHATLSGNGIICEGDQVTMQLNVEGVAPWKVTYTDGTQLYDITVNQRISEITHTPTKSCTYKLIKVVDNDGMGCNVEVSGEVPVEVHMVPELTILGVETDCCYGESVKVDMVMANEGGWSITYTDGIQRFTNAHDYLVVTPTQTGVKTYTISRISNAYCSKDIDYNFDVTTYQVPTLNVELPQDKVCEPNALEIGLETAGNLPMLLKYTLNGTPFEKEITQANEVISVDATAYQQVNNFTFETIASGQKCQSTINQTYTIEVGLLPQAAKYINGKANICHDTRETFTTAPLQNADTYHWTVPQGYTIVSGLGGTTIEVVAGPDAQSGEISVCGVNACGEGKKVSFPVYLDSPIATDGRIDFGATYYCLDGKFITATVSEVAGATGYKWSLPTGFTDVSSVGNTVKQSILIEMDELARTTQISVTPFNHCTSATPITATVTVRENPVAEAGTDIIKPCKDNSVIMNAKPVVGVGPTPDQNWQMVDGDGNIIDQKDPNSEVNQLLYGSNTLLWVINDGYCTGWDTVRVFNRTPVLTYPEAEEVTICEDFMTLRAPEPTFDKGRWKLIGGDGEILDPDNNVTEIIGLSTSGVNEVRWEVYNEFCSESTSMYITSNSLHELADAGQDGVTTNGSFRLSAQHYNDPQVTGTWSVVSGSGVIAEPNSPSTIVSGLAQGINTLRWTLKGYDCEAYDEIQIRSADEPVAGFNMDTNRGCEPLTIQFDNITIGQANFEWDFGDGRYSTLRSPEHTFDKAGIYTIKLTAKGKYKTDVTEKQIEVLPSPTAAFTVSSTQVYVPNAEVSFNGQTLGMAEYYWDFGDGHSSTQKDPFYTYTENGEYDVTFIVTDLNGCKDTLTYEKYIRVGEGAFIVFPTAFAPNVSQMLDGKYSPEERRFDIFYPVWKNVEILHLDIYNQWGIKVFTTDQLDQGWNGYYLGQPAAQGTYVYKAEGRYQDGTSFRLGGSVLLIR